MKRKPTEYLADLYYGATRYPCGWMKPRVVLGYFVDNEVGDLQRKFFEELQAQQFRRTSWQLVFPGQTAGLIKPIPVQEDGVNEYHVRFYDDGIIDCELEVDRFNSMHWAGPRRHGVNLLNELLDKAVTIPSGETRDRIRELFGMKGFSENCIR